MCKLLFVSWKHWIPSYVRGEIKKKTGLHIDGYGNKIVSKEKNNANESLNGGDDSNLASLLSRTAALPNQTKTAEYTPIDKYTPSGKMIYNSHLLQNIEDRTKTAHK